MAIKLGSGNIVFRSGDGSPSQVFLGSNPVQSLPDAPTVASALDSGEGSTIVTYSLPESTGGSPLLSLKFYMDGVLQQTYTVSGPLIPTFVSVTGNFAGQESQVSAVTAVGEGPLSNSVTVT